MSTLAEDAQKLMQGIEQEMGKLQATFDTHLVEKQIVTSSVLKNELKAKLIEHKNKQQMAIKELVDAQQAESDALIGRLCERCDDDSRKAMSDVEEMSRVVRDDLR